MTIHRRDFIATASAAALGGLSALGGLAGAGALAPRRANALTSPGTAKPTASAGAAEPVSPPRPAELKLSIQDGVMVGRSLTEKLDNMEAMGFVGLEVGGGGLAGRVESLQKALSGRKVKMSAICAGFDGWLIAQDPEIRKKAISSTKEILTAAGALGSTGMIIVPAFNGQPSLPHHESRKLLVDLLKDLGEHAGKAGTRILLEPLNRGECYFLRLLADAAAICKDVNHAGVAMMGDFWHMTWEETSDLGAFISAGSYLHHVHIASRKTRRIPTMDAGDDYTLGLKGLKWIGYQDYISLECGGPDSAEERKKVLADCVKLIRDQWAEA